MQKPENLIGKGRKMGAKHMESGCTECGALAVHRYDKCIRHLSTPAIRLREEKTRAELHAALMEAAFKRTIGVALTAREQECYDSWVALQERFGGKYPEPTPRAGKIGVTIEGDICDVQEVSQHFRARQDQSEKKLKNLFDTL